MLNVERKIILNSDYINKDIYLGENVISEGLISFIKTGSNNTVIPANYMNFVYKDDILIIDDVLYDVNSLKVNYLLKIYDLDYSMQKEFDTYDKMEEYITLFKREYDSKDCLINEDILKKIFELQNEKKDNIKKLFIDADKKCGRLLKR